MIDWETELISADIKLGEMNINWDIFQVAFLSPLLFVLPLIPLALFSGEMEQWYSFQKGKSKLNHIRFMEDPKLYGKN